MQGAAVEALPRILFHLQFHGSYIEGFLSPNVTAKVHVLNCSLDKSVVKQPGKKYHAGRCYTGQIIATHGGFVEVSFIGMRLHSPEKFRSSQKQTKRFVFKQTCFRERKQCQTFRQVWLTQNHELEKGASVCPGIIPRPCCNPPLPLKCCCSLSSGQRSESLCEGYAVFSRPQHLCFVFRCIEED